jgi:hypothetical protein
MWHRAMCASLVLASATAQAAPHIRLKGRAQLDVHLSREQGALALAGTAVDDAARPISNARIGVTVWSAADAERTPISLRSVTSQGCRGLATPSELDGPSLLVLQADAGGRFCARLALQPGNYAAHIEAYSSGFVEASQIELPFDLRLPPLTLRFDPEAALPQPLWLDSEEVSLEAIASTEDEGATSPAAGIGLVISNETGEQLGSARTDGSGRARFRIDPIRLGDPGASEVRAIFGGDESAGASTHAMRVELRTRVDLAVADPRAKRMPTAWQAWQDDAIRVVATARCARRGCKKVPTGTIEARVEGKRVVGAAPLNRGVATLVLASYSSGSNGPSDSRGDIPVTIQYIPDAPWFESGGELVLEQALRGPSAWRKLPLVLAALAVIAWLALMRIPIRARRRAMSNVETRVQLVRSAPPSHGWTGQIGDAHDGNAIAGARVSIVRRSFAGVEVLAEAYSGATGAFALPPIVAQPGDELVAEGHLHARLRSALPHSGELAVRLVLRKRALLDELVSWARRRGTPYDKATEPTPGQVKEVAGADDSVTRWAGALEEAAYGGRIVDERAQEQVQSLAPASEADDVDATHPRSL